MELLDCFGFPPTGGGSIFDTHAHYDDRQYDRDRDFLLKRLPEYGVCGAVCCGTDRQSSFDCVALSERYPYLYAAVGVHPHEAEAAGNPGDFPFEELLRHSKAVAIGEVGLDYHYDHSPREVQRDWFVYQLEAAIHHDVPVIIHSREATADTLDIVRPRPTRGVIHCFSGSVETANIWLSMGYYIGFGGAVTFKNAHKLRETVRAVPLDRLLLETDAPYMTPEPYRGRRCHSGHIAFTAAVIAEVRGCTVGELYEAARANAMAAFEIN